MSFFRYPGGKTKLREPILACLAQQISQTTFSYGEPFFGGGSIGLAFLTHHRPQSIWLNDKDAGLAALWTSVMKYPHELQCLIRKFHPSVRAFEDFKQELLAMTTVPSRSTHLVQLGFKKLAIHQISYSGLGTKSGGPLGGQQQESKYKIDCRWSSKYLCQKIDTMAHQMSRWTFQPDHCTAQDFEPMIRSTTHHQLLYLDPPYYEQGNKLYQHGFTVSDHHRLADALQQTSHDWVLSYDDCSTIRKLYRWAKIKKLTVGYSINTARVRKELLICAS